MNLPAASHSSGLLALASMRERTSSSKFMDLTSPVLAWTGKCPAIVRDDNGSAVAAQPYALSPSRASRRARSPQKAIGS